MAEKHIDFKVNYRKLRIFEECNTSEIKFPMVLSAPHCGQFFPEEFLNAVKMDVNELRSNEDSFVDELVRPASDAGIPMISMNINRCLLHDRLMTSLSFTSLFSALGFRDHFLQSGHG